MAVLLLAVAGELVQLRADTNFDVAHGLPASLLPERADFTMVWEPAAALVHGHGAYPWFGDHFVLGYAPPFIVLFAPSGFLSRDLAIFLSVALTVFLGGGTVIAWAGSGHRVEPWLLALLVSAPLVAAVRVDQLMSAMGLAALCLAIWASRRDLWWLAGTAAALGLARTSNALPVVAMLLVSGWGRPRRLLEAAAGGALLLVPLVLVAFAWDANWIHDYAHNLSFYPIVGLARVARQLGGEGGDVGFVLAGCGIAAASVWPCRGRPLHLDRAAFGLATTSIFASQGGLFTGLFALPAVARLSLRPGFAGVAWLVAAVPWLVILVLAPRILGTHSEDTNLLTLLVPMMVIVGYPLVRSSGSSSALASG